MINKSRIQKVVETFLIVFTLIYSGFPSQAQNQLEKNLKSMQISTKNIE